ncbi:poly(A) polymerase [Micromonospora pallida]|uniref:poly(A) polymerase n=1 Tax=Micromonospora pallida TaxID=145854 RepID=UPI001FE1E084|nr:poly(A) polymerase [Micromonospora pallida]
MRRTYDPQVDRWPPHVNLLHGFVPESDFDRAVELVSQVTAGITPFAARLAGTHTFTHRDHTTVWLDPAAGDPAPWQALRASLAVRFPHCRGRADGYTPHLTLGRTGEPERLTGGLAARLTPVTAPVDTVVLLSRRGDGPMRPRATVALGTGEIRWLPDVVPDVPAPRGGPASRAGARTGGAPAEALVRRIADALPDAVVMVAGSRRMGCDLPDADVDLVAALPGTVDLAEVRTRLAAALPEADALREVIGARVPGLRLRAGGRNVDLVVVATGDLPPGEAVARRAELGEPAAVALSAVSDADAVLAVVGAERDTFARLARQVKAWARARGLDSAPHGWLPGLAWAVLAARTVADGGRDLVDFFGTWAAWDWRQPIALPGHPAVPDGAVAVATPTSPVRSCTGQVGVGGPDLLTQEFYDAWEITMTDPDPWPRLLTPPPLHRRHAAWAVLTVGAVPDEPYPVTAGRVRGRIRALLSVLESTGSPDVHAWPWPFETAAGLTRHAIGLGRTPPDRDRFPRLTADWCADLPGVHVGWAAGGAVPTLTAPPAAPPR